MFIFVIYADISDRIVVSEVSVKLISREIQHIIYDMGRHVPVQFTELLISKT